MDALDQDPARLGHPGRGAHNRPAAGGRAGRGRHPAARQRRSTRWGPGRGDEVHRLPADGEGSRRVPEALLEPGLAGTAHAAKKDPGSWGGRGFAGRLGRGDREPSGTAVAAI